MFVWSGLISGYDLANEEQQRGRKLKKSPADIRASSFCLPIKGGLTIFGRTGTLWEGFFLDLLNVVFVSTGT